MNLTDQTWTACVWNGEASTWPAWGVGTPTGQIVATADGDWAIEVREPRVEEHDSLYLVNGPVPCRKGYGCAATFARDQPIPVKYQGDPLSPGDFCGPLNRKLYVAPGVPGFRFIGLVPNRQDLAVVIAENAVPVFLGTLDEDPSQGSEVTVHIDGVGGLSALVELDFGDIKAGDKVYVTKNDKTDWVIVSADHASNDEGDDGGDDGGEGDV